MLLTIVSFLASAMLFQQAGAVSVMSVDLGAEWMKVAIVSPGVPMEIALNKESKRKTPTAVAFYRDERTFGEDALNVCTRCPTNCYIYFLDLIGKHIDNPAVKLFQKRFPYYNLVEDPVRGTVMFKHDDGSLYSPEELVGMLLHKAKEFAEISANQPITEVVITVPGYFGQVERKAILQAAQLSGLNVLQLMNDYTAAALTYGIFRTKDFNETAQYIMLYDMGAYSTTAVIVSYQVVKTKERGSVESNPQLSVLGVGYDRTLGGVEMQLRLRDYLGKKFNEMKKTKTDVFTNPRALAKLYKEAGRLKYILSANTEHYAQVEGLLEDIDFKVLITRDEFEELCSDLFKRVRSPVDQALKHSSLSLDVINQIIMVGAGTRVPAVQQMLAEAVQKELGKSLNTDEAVVLGAAYRAADLSKGFKVKKFLTKDAVLFPIQVQFEKENSGASGNSKLATRTLFSLMNPYPQKKVLTFNKHHHDFWFTVQYGDLSVWPSHEVEVLSSLVLANVSLSGVNSVVEKHMSKGSNVEPKGIKVHFNIDDSGVLRLSGAEYVIEKTVFPGEDVKDEAESAFSKISGAIGKLFHSSSDSEKGEAIEEQKEKPVTEEGKQRPEAGKTADDGVDNKQNKTESADSAEKEGKQPKTEEKKEPKVVVLKEAINTKDEDIAATLLLNEEQFTASAKKIRELMEKDLAKARKEGALNSLESAIIETRIAIQDEQQLLPFATSREAEAAANKCNELSEWMDEEGYTAEANILESKLAELKKITKPIRTRYWEHLKRPEMLKVLDDSLASTVTFVQYLKNMTDVFNASSAGNATALPALPYTPVDIDTLEKLIKNTRQWKERMVKDQNTAGKTADPILTGKAIEDKVTALNREVRYLMNKAKNWVPPEPPKPTKTEETGEESEKSKGKSKEKSKNDKEPKVQEEEKDGVVEEESEEITPEVTQQGKESHSEL